MDLQPLELIATRILLIRGQRVMIDTDLAELYGVSTKALNQAIKRNHQRFPADFMLQLTAEEKSGVVTDCDHLKKLKFSKTLPFAFTEHGAIQAANVLNSPQAIGMGVLVGGIGDRPRFSLVKIMVCPQQHRNADNKKPAEAGF